MVDAQNEVKNTKPVYRNIGLAQLIHYRLPWAGKVSITPHQRRRFVPNASFYPVSLGSESCFRIELSEVPSDH